MKFSQNSASTAKVNWEFPSHGRDHWGDAFSFMLAGGGLKQR
ncbi:MAG: hypothetical protein U0936_00060 [Planctomycetaceae bacterium]